MNNKKNIKAALAWLMLAQDKTGDGGVSAWFSLLNGWQPSYIETTGYIINTFLDAYEYFKDPQYRSRAIKMADFLLKMQLPNGAYKLYTPKQKNDDAVVVFNMGQDLIGISAIYELTNNKKYLKSAIAAAEYLLSIQEKDGSWVKNTYGNTTHTYHTRVAWGILKVYQISGKNKFKTAAIKNLEWAKSQQLPNGWFAKNELPQPNIQLPYTHTISYAVEGFLWSGLILSNSQLLKIALRGSVPLLNYYLKHNFLPGSFDSNWQSQDKYSCLTGDAQISLMWLELYKITKNKKFLYAASKMNKYLKTKQLIASPFKAINGAIAGSDPIYGDILKNQGYCRLAYLNWATKFFIDALLTEQKIIDSTCKR
ncbi:MAG: hypothetical protein BroJett025_04960 [Patescibacteria group bacterium]|nr:MAG: hypothetical protein BroJett025_04960 [Patescibacteria group bacterium]